MKPKHHLLLNLLSFAFAFFAGVSAAAQTPEVNKVEPPSWWIGSSLNPVRVLIKGRNMSGARVQAVERGLRVVGNPKTNQSGSYMFVDLEILPNAPPGERTLKVSNTNGSAEAHWEILPRRNRRGSFQGFSADDVMYLVMIDRFSDGDQANNDLPQSRGLYDRQNKYYYHGGDLQGVIDRLPYLIFEFLFVKPEGPGPKRPGIKLLFLKFQNRFSQSPGSLLIKENTVFNAFEGPAPAEGDDRSARGLGFQGNDAEVLFLGE